jgi:hypothetical protein
VSRHEVNYKNWAENAVSFIREKNLTTEFTDWCGGWSAPIATIARPEPHPNAIATYEALAYLLDIVGDLHETGKTSDTRLDLLQQAVRRLHGGAVRKEAV